MNINLLPWREQRLKQKFFHFLLMYVSCIAAIITMLIVIHINLDSHNRTTFLAYSHLQSYLDQLPHLPHQQMQLWQQLQRERHTILATIQIIVRALPSTCYLTKIRYHRQWLLEGRAPNAQLMNDFIHHLQQNHLFHHVQLTNMTKRRAFIFSIKIT